MNGRDTALPKEAEYELVKEIIHLEECLFGLTINDVRKLAYDFLVSNPHLKNPFNKTKQTAGKKCFLCQESIIEDMVLCFPVTNGPTNRVLDLQKKKCLFAISVGNINYKLS